MQPDITDNSESSGTNRRDSRKPRSPWGLAVAVVAGGALAFGIAQLVPDDWRINLARNAKPNKRSLHGKGEINIREGDETPDASASATAPKREDDQPPRRIIERPNPKPSPPKTREGREAAALLKEAKSLIAKGKKSEAVPILERIYNVYPGTSAATEALELVNGL